MMGDIQSDQQLDMMKAQMKMQAQMEPEPEQQSKSEPKKSKPKSGSSKEQLPNKIDYPEYQAETAGTFDKIKKIL